MTKIPVHKKVIDGLNKIFIKSITWYLMAVALLVLSIIFFYGSFLNEKPFESTNFLLAVIYFLLALLALYIGIICKRSEAKKSKYGYREYLLQELKKEQIVFTPDENINIYDQNADDDVVEDNIADTKRLGKKDILAQMLDNNDEIKEYFKISKSQAKISFVLSVITCIAGVIMLAIAFYWAIIVKKYEMAIFGIVSGAIGEVISGTVLWVHNKSALQLNHYYDALHQNEKFLSAINMADRLSEARREEMYIEIIRKQTEIQLSNDTNT